MSMTEQEKAFVAQSDEYQTEVFTVVHALKTLHDSNRIGSLSIGTNEKNKEFMEDVQLVLKTLNKNDEDDEDDEDESNDDSEPEPEEESAGFSTIDEMETFMSNTSDALLHLTKELASIKFQTMLNTKAIIKLIDERERHES